MKKLIVLSVLFALTLLAFNAQALTNSTTYDSSFSRSVPLALETGDSWGKALAFNDPVPFTSAIIELTFTNAIDGYVPSLGVSLPPIAAFFASTNQTNFLFASNLRNGPNTFAITGDALKNLNAAITAGGIPFGMAMVNGGISLKSAHLYGNLAPEPISVALVGAGLVGLPFVRRLRKSMTREA